MDRLGLNLCQGLVLACALAGFAQTPSLPASNHPLIGSPVTQTADSGLFPAAPASPEGAPVEAVHLDVQGAFTASQARAGDSLDYVLRVEWADAGVPVMVLAPDSLDFPGFKVIGQATVHKKLATVSGIANRTEFIYRLRAHTPGSGKASSLKLRYLSGISRNEEAVYVPTAHLDILPGRTPLLDSLWFRLVAAWFALAACGALAWAAFRFASRKRRGKPADSKPDLRPEVLALKSRLRTATIGTHEASKSILLQMEDICIRHLRQELGDASKAPGDGSKEAAPRFDPLLDQYLARNGAAEAEPWNGLRDLFRHARFAGGHKEPHELQDAFRTLKKCLKITEEPGED